MLGRLLSYTVMFVWELAQADSALVILDEWLSYRGGRFSRFDCTFLIWKLVTAMYLADISSMYITKNIYSVRI